MGNPHPRILRSRIAALALVACLVAAALPAPAAAQGEDTGAVQAANVAFDVLVLRPLGAVNTAVGAALFVPAALLASPGGRDPIEEAWSRFVVEPGEFAFQRPLGEF